MLPRVRSLVQALNFSLLCKRKLQTCQACAIQEHFDDNFIGDYEMIFPLVSFSFVKVV